MISVICTTCGRTFEQNEKVSSGMAHAVGRDSKKICYNCALASLTGGRAPEEGDFNSAHLISGEISDKELGWLMDDLESVDHSRAEVQWRSQVEEDDDSGRWDYLEERDE